MPECSKRLCSVLPEGRGRNQPYSGCKKADSKNKIYALEFPKNEEKPEKKKEVEYPYIETDEDHVLLQFW